MTGLPVVELDTYFWTAGLAPATDWPNLQDTLVAAPAWSLDADLSPYDVALDARLAAADTAIVLDVPLWRCAWRAARRSRPRSDVWRWLLSWRRESRPALFAALARHDVEVHVLRTQRDVDAFMARQSR